MDKLDPDKKGIIFVIILFSVLIIFATYRVVDLSDYPSWIETSELTISNLDVTIGDPSTGKIIIQAINSGTLDITVSEIKVNNETAYWEATNSPTLTAGTSETFTVTHEIKPETKYTITFFSSEGHLVGAYTKTSPPTANSQTV